VSKINSKIEGVCNNAKVFTVIFDQLDFLLNKNINIFKKK